MEIRNIFGSKCADRGVVASIMQEIETLDCTEGV